MSRITDLLARMQDAGIPIERGTPATDQEVAALEAGAGTRFPADYAAFLKTFGSLRTGRCFVYGTGEEAGIGAAAAEVEQEFATWEQPAAEVTPVISGSRHFPQECVVLDGQGRLQYFRRGHLKPMKASFEEEAAGWLGDELEDHLKEVRAREARDRVLAVIRDRVTGDLLADEAPAGVFHLRRPGGGSPIEIRFGNGREYWYKAPGVFVHWSEPSAKSPQAMNEFNRQARLVRGCVQDGRDRYRGLLPADEPGAAALVSALAHDAGLPFSVDAGSGPSLEQVAAALPPSPVSPEKSLLLAVMGQDGEPPEFERDGDALLLSAPSLANDAVKHAVRIRVAGPGLVEVSHVLAAPLAWPRINELNGGAVKDADPNRDDESMLRAVQDGASTVLSFVTTLAGLTNGAYLHDLTSLIRLADQALPPAQGDEGDEA